jgi:hypothetical protein
MSHTLRGHSVGVTYKKLKSFGIVYAHVLDREINGGAFHHSTTFPLDARTNSPTRFNLVSQKHFWPTHRCVGHLFAETVNMLGMK